MKTIRVYLREQCYEAQVDDEDYEFLSQPLYRWTAKISHKTVYAQTNIEYLGEWYNIGMHRMVIGDAVKDSTYRIEKCH